MRVRVVGIVRDEDGAVFAAFECSAGHAKARWVSKFHRPEIGNEYDVELDVDETADRLRNVNDGMRRDLGLSIESGAVVLVAKVEAVEDDGLACLRLSDDCLIMIETSGDFRAGEIVQVSVPARSVSMTVTGSV